jgi:hypothetical protein
VFTIANLIELRLFLGCTAQVSFLGPWSCEVAEGFFLFLSLFVFFIAGGFAPKSIMT